MSLDTRQDATGVDRLNRRSVIRTAVLASTVLAGFVAFVANLQEVLGLTKGIAHQFGLLQEPLPPAPTLTAKFDTVELSGSNVPLAHFLESKNFKANGYTSEQLAWPGQVVNFSFTTVGFVDQQFKILYTILALDSAGAYAFIPDSPLWKMNDAYAIPNGAFTSTADNDRGDSVLWIPYPDHPGTFVADLRLLHLAKNQAIATMRTPSFSVAN
jgi:hypothetical protein